MATNPNWQDILNEMYRWNNKYPVDLWWRLKYKISFGSDQHLSMNMLDMVFEYLQDQALKEKHVKIEYVPGSRDWLLSQSRFVEEDFVEDFDDIIENEDGTRSLVRK